MPLVIVGHRACPPLLDRQPGLRAVERLDLTLLIDREDQRVGRRVEIEAHDIVKLLREVWVVAELEVRTKCGLSPWRFQIRRTLAGLMHSSAARVRVLQCVAVGGRSRVVLRMTSASTAPCWTVAGRPRPGASFSIPAVRCAANRRRQSPTVFSRIPRSAAMVVFSQPSAARSTILARRTRRAGVRRPLDHCRRTFRSSSDSVKEAATRACLALKHA